MPSHLDPVRQDPAGMVPLGDRMIDLDSGLIRSPDGTETILSLLQCEVLRALMRERGRVLSYAALGREVWQYPEGWCSPHEIQSCVCRLRQKLGAAAGAIQTVRNVGYCFRRPALGASDTASERSEA